MKTTEKTHTAGLTTISQSGDRVIKSNGDTLASCVYGNHEENVANAKLIQEAFNVTNETGKTPRQLADENKDLLDTLIEVRKHMTAHIPERIFDLVDNEINKATK